MTDPLTEAVARAIKLCDVCDGEGTVCDGMDEAGCSMPCPVCFGTGYDVTAAYAAMREAMEPVNRKKFPILGAPGATIDWQLVHDHGRQAKANHYQTVERLAERGGLSWCELHAILHNRPWQKMEENTAIMECRALEARYLSSILPEIKP